MAVNLSTSSKPDVNDLIASLDHVALDASTTSTPAPERPEAVTRDSGFSEGEALQPKDTPTATTDLDNLTDALSSIVISEAVPRPARSWLEDVGFEQEKLDPIYLLALLARERLRLCSNETFKRELLSAIDKVEARRQPILKAILKRIEVVDREVEDWELQGLNSVFTRDDDLLTLLLQERDLSILMIEETPRLSSAIGVIGNRVSTSKVRATCWKEPGEPIRVALTKHLARCKGVGFRELLEEVIENDGDNCGLFDAFSSSEEAQQFDATIPESYAALDYSYDIVFGHCLWPELGELIQDPGFLLLRILQAIKHASESTQDRKSTLVVFTIPNDDYWAKKYDIAWVIRVMEGDFQYLGFNRVIEGQIRGYGYRHEKTKGRGKEPEDIHSLQYLADGLLAYSFILRGKRNWGEHHDVDP